MSKNGNVDIRILNDAEIPSMIQTVGRLKKVMLRIKEHARTCGCCRDIMNDSQIRHQHNFEAVGNNFEYVIFRCRGCGYEFVDLYEPL